MEDNKNMTEAELQIERLKKLKEEKDLKYQKMKDEAMPYIPGKTTAQKLINKPVRKKILGMVKIDKNTFEKVHRLVNKMSKENPQAKVGKERFVNIILKEILKDEALFSGIKSAADLKNLLTKMMQK